MRSYCAPPPELPAGASSSRTEEAKALGYVEAEAQSIPTKQGEANEPKHLNRLQIEGRRGTTVE